MSEQPKMADDEAAELFKALGHPTRLRILRRLAQHESYCNDLVELFDQAQSTISHHLKSLKDAGLVVSETQGTSVCYSVNRERLHELNRIVKVLDEQRP